MKKIPKFKEKARRKPELFTYFDFPSRNISYKSLQIDRFRIHYNIIKRKDSQNTISEFAESVFFS